MARQNPTVRVGNYAAPIDTQGMDPEMKNMLAGLPPKPMNKVESDYVAGAQNKATARVAVSRARRANKSNPLPGD